MASSNETIGKTFLVATVLCLVCAVIVSTAAVALRPYQQANQRADIQRNILAIADMYDPSRSVEEQFAQVETRVVDLDQGTFADIDPTGFDQLKAARDPSMSDPLNSREDIASLSRREKFGAVYLVNDEAGELDKIILPIRGYGLWGTLYGFIALDGTSYEVIGLGYYQHAETPGLGGEVDNPNWRAQWVGKQIYDNSLENVVLQVVKGNVNPADPAADQKVEGLSGATLTSRGIQFMIDFWMGEQGYAKFLRNLKAGNA